MIVFDEQDVHKELDAALRPGIMEYALEDIEAALEILAKEEAAGEDVEYAQQYLQYVEQQGRIVMEDALQREIDVRVNECTEVVRDRLKEEAGEWSREEYRERSHELLNDEFQDALLIAREELEDNAREFLKDELPPWFRSLFENRH